MSGRPRFGAPVCNGECVEVAQTCVPVGFQRVGDVQVALALDTLKKALTERTLNAEKDHRLVSGRRWQSRNGYSRKSVTTETGNLEIDVPRDRQSSFDPQLIAKYQRRFSGLW